MKTDHAVTSLWHGNDNACIHINEEVNYKKLFVGDYYTVILSIEACPIHNLYSTSILIYCMPSEW